MKNKIRTVITGTGSYIPTVKVKNEDFLDNEFYTPKGEKITTPNEETISKFFKITGIAERRYVTNDLNASDIGYYAAKDALESSGIDKESIDYIIVAHNFGDISYEDRYSDFVPTLAGRIKKSLGIENPYCVATDLPFGCPGWLQGMIQADIFLKAGAGKRAMVIGAETLSRISDPHDRDSMIYSDGAGATILESTEDDGKIGLLSHCTRSDTIQHAELLHMGNSYNPDHKKKNLYLKMEGHKLYKYAISKVPGVVKEALDEAELDLTDISQIYIHQANEKMDEEILRRLFHLYGKEDITKEEIHSMMPMTISYLGNSSVATLPTLMDLTIKNQVTGHKFTSGEKIVFASVGAGMNINAAVYVIP